MYLIVVILAYVCIPTSSTTLENGNLTLTLNITLNNGILVTLTDRNITKLTGRIGTGIKFLSSVEYSSGHVSLKAQDFEFGVIDTINGFNIFWESSNTSRIFQDCFDLNPNEFDWFSGKEGNTAEWPIQNQKIKTAAYIVRDTNSIAESYWLHSKGAFIFVNETVPLFVDQNNLVNNGLCLIAKNEAPYVNRKRVLLNYTIAANENATSAHKNAIDNYLGRPTGIPNSKMIREPIWSTWIKYQNDINDDLVFELGESIRNNEFRGQVQIEDGWEECRGSLTFKKYKFAAINNTIRNINSFALRVTLWIHPYVDVDCEDYVKIGKDKDYFVKDSNGDYIIVSWWASNSSYLIDFTNVEAKNWFMQRVGLLVEKHGLDGFKFEGGEASWATNGAVLRGDPEREPNEITYDYNSLTNFTDFVQINSGWRTQWLPVFVRISEKEPNWSLENGLKSVVINVMQLNIAGYTVVSPGLIGGNKLLDRPSPELYVRWVQAVTFMPIMEFGYLPWEIIGTNFDVLKIVRKFVDLHYYYTDGINNIIKKCKSTGLPVNPPVWWIDSANSECFKINDQYLLGEHILVAPILSENVVSRDIYLPPGRWQDGNNGTRYDGNQTLKNYPAPIDVLPYFTKERE